MYFSLILVFLCYNARRRGKRCVHKGVTQHLENQTRIGVLFIIGAVDFYVGQWQH